MSCSGQEELATLCALRPRLYHSLPKLSGETLQEVAEAALQDVIDSQGAAAKAQGIGAV